MMWLLFEFYLSTDIDNITMSNFSFTKLGLEGAYLIEYFSVGDNRGGFSKSFEKDIYKEAGIDFTLNETFISVSAKNVIRGLHFQTRNPQAKLVSVPKGKVYDVIVDLRPESPTFKKWEGYELSDQNHKALYVPRGFAHGFVSLEDETWEGGEVECGRLYYLLPL